MGLNSYVLRTGPIQGESAQGDVTDVCGNKTGFALTWNGTGSEVKLLEDRQNQATAGSPEHGLPPGGGVRQLSGVMVNPDERPGHTEVHGSSQTRDASSRCDCKSERTDCAQELCADGCLQGALKCRHTRRAGKSKAHNRLQILRTWVLPIKHFQLFSACENLH